MHIGALGARMMPRLLAQYRAEGFTFTTLAKAEADPVYAADVNPSLAPAPPRWQQMQARGLTPTPTEDFSKMLDSLCRLPSKPAAQ